MSVSVAIGGSVAVRQSVAIDRLRRGGVCAGRRGRRDVWGKVRLAVSGDIPGVSLGLHIQEEKSAGSV